MRQSTNQEKYIAFDLAEYNSEEEMFHDISSLLKILTKNRYQCAFRYEDGGIYVVEFDMNDESFGSPMIYWLDNEQVDCLYTSKYIGDDEDDETRTSCGDA